MVLVVAYLIRLSQIQSGFTGTHWLKILSVNFKLEIISHLAYTIYEYIDSIWSLAFIAYDFTTLM